MLNDACSTKQRSLSSRGPAGAIVCSPLRRVVLEDWRKSHPDNDTPVPSAPTSDTRELHTRQAIIAAYANAVPQRTTHGARVAQASRDARDFNSAANVRRRLDARNTTDTILWAR